MRSIIRSFGCGIISDFRVSIEFIIGENERSRSLRDTGRAAGVDGVKTGVRDRRSSFKDGNDISENKVRSVGGQDETFKNWSDKKRSSLKALKET